MPAWFYILRLRSGCLYPGSTTDLARRLDEHRTGKGGRTTALDSPAGLVLQEEYATFGDARRREAQVKRWSRAKKEALVTGDRARLPALAVSHDHKL
jgi:putative endonuclease